MLQGRKHDGTPVWERFGVRLLLLLCFSLQSRLGALPEWVPPAEGAVQTEGEESPAAEVLEFAWK